MVWMEFPLKSSVVKFANVLTSSEVNAFDAQCRICKLVRLVTSKSDSEMELQINISKSVNALTSSTPSGLLLQFRDFKFSVKVKDVIKLLLQPKSVNVLKPLTSKVVNWL